MPQPPASPPTGLDELPLEGAGDGGGEGEAEGCPPTTQASAMHANKTKQNARGARMVGDAITGWQKTAGALTHAL